MFSFNIYSSLLLPAVIQCLLFAILTARRYYAERKYSDLFLSLILLFTGIKLSFWMLGFAGWYDSYDWHTTFMFYFPFSTFVLIGPLIYFYFKSLTNNKFSVKKEHWAHFVLPVCFLIMVIGKFALDFLVYAPFPREVDYQYGTRGPLAEIDKSGIINLIGFIYFLFYLSLILRSFPVYRRYVKENFSDSSNLDLTWLRNMLMALFAGVFILLAFRVVEFLNGGISYKTDWYGYAALATISYYVCIKGYYIPSRQFYQLEYRMADANADRQKVEINEEEKKWLLSLNVLMQGSKPYLQPELSLSDLANILGTNKSVLSRVINQHYHQNFNDFINQYRVDEVIDELKNKKHLQHTLMGIAYDCGFNSKATFNRAFKKATGQTPQQYIGAYRTTEK